MRFAMIQSDVFPIEGAPRVGTAAVVAPINVDGLADIAGGVCTYCGDQFEPGEVVTLIRDLSGVLYVHDRDIKREEVE